MLRRTTARLLKVRDSGLVLVGRDTADPRVAVVTLNNKEKLNALTTDMGDAFASTMEDLRTCTDLRAVVVTGSGTAFSAGGDIAFLRDRVATGEEEAANVQTMLAFYDRFLSIKTQRVPTVAAVNGHAIGAGLCLAMACDIRIAAVNAKLALNFVKLGMPPGMGGSFHLSRLVGPQVAAKMVFTGEPVTGEEGVRLGLCLEACPQQEVLPQALDLARRIAATDAPESCQNLVVNMMREPHDSLPAALQREATSQAFCFRHNADGISAALDGITAKRK